MKKYIALLSVGVMGLTGLLFHNTQGYYEKISTQYPYYEYTELDAPIKIYSKPNDHLQSVLDEIQEKTKFFLRDEDIYWDTQVINEKDFEPVSHDIIASEVKGFLGTTTAVNTSYRRDPYLYFDDGANYFHATFSWSNLSLIEEIILILEEKLGLSGLDNIPMAYYDKDTHSIVIPEILSENYFSYLFDKITIAVTPNEMIIYFWHDILSNEIHQQLYEILYNENLAYNSFSSGTNRHAISFSSMIAPIYGYNTTHCPIVFEYEFDNETFEITRFSVGISHIRTGIDNHLINTFTPEMQHQTKVALSFLDLSNEETDRIINTIEQTLQKRISPSDDTFDNYTSMGKYASRSYSNVKDKEWSYKYNLTLK
ncbi:MAG: hypothetical protein ATN36_08855 [Epulopiscium sp. Nele67-Bin005]|nr:MAG: hypothetical protein ATN36_08855 [Epulopiscium sp. Nele67-Bin005]